MEEKEDSVTIRTKVEIWKKLRRIVFNSKQNDDEKFDSIHKIIDFMFNSLKDKSPLKDYLK